MKFIIHPHEGLEIPEKGIVKFGMSRQEVRHFFSGEPKVINKGRTPTDSFKYCSTFVFYDESGEAEAIEVAYDDSMFNKNEMMLNKKDFFSFKTGLEVKDFLKGMDGKIIVDGSGLDCLTFGVSIYSLELEKIESVLVARKGYLDSRFSK